MAKIYIIMKSIFINSMKGKFTYLTLLLLITINTLSQEFKGTDLLKKLFHITTQIQNGIHLMVILLLLLSHLRDLLEKV